MNTATQPTKIRSFDSTRTNSATRNTKSFASFLAKMKDQIGTGRRAPENYSSMNQKQLEARAAEDMAIAKTLGF